MKMTLDNPAVLEQKLEALEHHKKVLENQQARRLQLAAASGGSNGVSYREQPPIPSDVPRQFRSGSSASSVGNLSHHSQNSIGNGSNLGSVKNSQHYPQQASRENCEDGNKIYENYQQLYENVKVNDGNRSLNDTGARSGNNGDGPVYSNFHHHDARKDDALIYSNILHGNAGAGNGGAIQNDMRMQRDMASPYHHNLPYNDNHHGE